MKKGILGLMLLTTLQPIYATEPESPEPGAANLRASVHNLFDKTYVDPAPLGAVNGDFPREGRGYMLELAYKM